MKTGARFATLLFGLIITLILPVHDLTFSDPARQQPAPRVPAGYPSRNAGMDVLPGFRTPLRAKERLSWELDQLKDRHITALQFNYAHSDKGGQKFGLTYPSEPPLFSESWWELFGWFRKEARKQGMAVSLSDYTLGWPGQGWYFDEILKETPEVHGSALMHVSKECGGGQLCTWEMPADPISIVGYRKNSTSLDATSATDLKRHASGRTFQWTAPNGDWHVIAVYAVANPASIDPMHPLSGRQMIAKFFQPFEDRNPGEGGRGLNFFFSDELDFATRGWLWNKYFAVEFQKRKGYDIVPELPALFEDVGPRTPKVRLDYSDVMVSLEEENYFRPLYEWHTSRGMMYGCDHGGRGRDIIESSDYFRTQRWMSAPGKDQPNLNADVIKNKVASSIAHLYERPRTWLEGYHSSG